MSPDTKSACGSGSSPFAQAARNANGVVAFWHVSGLPRLVDGDLDCFFPHLWDMSRFPAGIVQLQELFSCLDTKFAEHVI